MKLSVFTQNCFGIPFPRTKRRLEKIADKILDLSPDVVFLQEIQWKRHVKIFDIPNYQTFFDDGRFATAGGLLTLLRKDFLGSHGFVKFKRQGGVRQIADRALGKGILDVVLSKENVHLVNTHLLATYMPGFLRDKGQLAQLKELISYLKPFEKFVAAGDLNFSEGSNYHKLLTSEFEDLSFDIGLSHPILKSKIDFVFGKGVKKVLSKRFVEYEGFVSDHKGIYCKIEL